MVKKLDELNLIDNFLFEALAGNPELGAAFGRKLVKIILHRIPEKVQIVAQRSYPGSNPQLHGARLDVYLEEESAVGKDEAPWSYDIEPEKSRTELSVRSLPKRVRFYHAKIDSKGLKAGDGYHKLRNVAVILIMPFDPFGLDRMVYTVCSQCVEEPDMPYDDGAFTMFLYTKGKKGIPSVELQQFLTYFEHTTQSNACNRDLQALHRMVSAVRTDEEVELAYMKIYEREEMIREEGYGRGLTQGLVQGRSEGSMLHLLQMMIKKISKGKNIETITEELEEDSETINRLFTLVREHPDKTAEELLSIETNNETDSHGFEDS
ncbi:MAG: Rpn family recombination-promoting nuclease/putative transposase [Acetatifactor sp.]|nr:Rpn family recombination-promoting nuclease/putative transposase [Acetatifactor sp.]